jgi:hypothetical protein
VDGHVVDLHLVPDQPVEDIADDLAARADRRNQGIRQPDVLDLAEEGRLGPWVAEGLLLDRQHLRQIVPTHPA